MAQPYTTGTQPAPGRSRGGLWIALGCAVMLVVLLFLAATGGVVYLVVRGGDSPEPSPTSPPVETAEFSHDYFRFTYPADWYDLSGRAGVADAGGVVELADEQIDTDDYEALAHASIVVYAFDSDYRAAGTCRTQATWTGFAWDSAEEPQELDPVTIGGRELPAYRTLGTHGGEDVIGEMYCADVGENVVQIVVETRGATAVDPELQAILDSWEWTARG